MRRGQVLSQVFILILAAAVFIMILLYGYSALKLFMERGKQICLLDMSNKLQSETKKIAIDAGSVDVLSIEPCEGFTDICIVDINNIPGFEAGAGKSHNLIRNLAESRTQNVFFIPPADFSFLVPNMRVRNGGFCRKFTGRINLRLEGFGDRAEISEMQAGAEQIPSGPTVEINAEGFSPATLTVSAGQEVTFVNLDAQPHWPASDPHPTHMGYISGACGVRFDACNPVPPGQSYAFRFTKKGTLSYHDHLNTGNQGVIVVQ